MLGLVVALLLLAPRYAASFPLSGATVPWPDFERADAARTRVGRSGMASPTPCGSVMAGAALVGPQQPTRHRRDLAHASPWVFLGLTRVGSGSLVCDAQTDDRAERGHGEVRCPCPEPWPVKVVVVPSCVAKG